MFKVTSFASKNKKKKNNKMRISINLEIIVSLLEEVYLGDSSLWTLC